MQTNLSLNFFIFVLCDVCMCEALLFALHICEDVSLAVISDGSGLEKCQLDVGPWVEIGFKFMQVYFDTGLEDGGAYQMAN